MTLFYTVIGLFFLVCSVVEYRINLKSENNYYSKSDFVSSIKLMLAGAFLDLMIKAVAVVLFLKLYEYSLLRLGYQWWVWGICYLAWDLVFYFKHYLEHNVRFMWAIHVNHHSSPYMNLSTALRSGVLKSGYRYFFWAVLIFIGFPVPMFLIVYAVGKLWAFFSHSRKLGTWGIFEKFTVTPTHHWLHHSYNENNLNKNFGETFLFWDYLFSTFKKVNEPLKFGIEKKVDFDDFGDVVFHEFKSMQRDWRRAGNRKEKLLIIFGKPGYKPKVKQDPVFRESVFSGFDFEPMQESHSE